MTNISETGGTIGMIGLVVAALVGAAWYDNDQKDRHGTQYADKESALVYNDDDNRLEGTVVPTSINCDGNPPNVYMVKCDVTFEGVQTPTRLWYNSQNKYDGSRDLVDTIRDAVDNQTALDVYMKPEHLGLVVTYARES